MTKKQKKKKRKLKKIPKIFFLIIIIIVLVFLAKKSLDDYEINISNTYDYIMQKIEEKKNAQDKKNEETKKYNDCLNQEYSSDELSGELQEKEIETTAYLKKYSVSVKFQDIKTKYTYQYNENQKYYAASTIKMLDALYIYQEAAKGNIDLETTIAYTYKISNSAGVSKHKIGDKISLRNLVKYAITVSDNTAHQMLVKYIGYDNLKQYGNSLGATTTLEHTVLGKDNFGDINVTDAIIYVQELYNFINENPTLGAELKSYFITSDENYLKDTENNIEAATKYGEYNAYFHNNGIVYAENPYFISVLTKLNSNKSIVTNINKKIQELQNVLYENRKNYCQQKIYNVQINWLTIKTRGLKI